MAECVECGAEYEVDDAGTPLTDNPSARCDECGGYIEVHDDEY